MPSPRLRSIVVVAVLTGSASAQTILELERFTDVSGPADTFTRIVAGVLTGHSSPDVVGLSGTTPRLAVAPQLFHAHVDLPITANDIGILPGGGANGLDALVFVGSSGLQKWYWDGEAGQIESFPGASADWVNASRLRIAPFGSGSTPSIIATKSDGHTILLLPNASSTVTKTADVCETIEAIETIRWDASAGEDIAVVTDGGSSSANDKVLRLYHVDTAAASPLTEIGTGIWGNASSSAPPDTLVPVRENTSSQDKLLWITPQSLNSSSQFGRVMKQGTTEEAPIDFGPLGIVAAIAADANGDGKDDLLINQKYSANLVLIYNQTPAAPTFDLQIDHIFLVPWGTTVPSNMMTRPCSVDWDGDGDLDGVFAANDVPRFLLFRNGHVNERLKRIKIKQVRTNPDPLEDGVSDIIVDLHALADMAYYPPDATNVEIVVWYQSGFAAPPGFRNTEQQPLGRAIQHLPSPLFAGENVLLMSVPIQLTQTVAYDSVLTLQVRLRTDALEDYDRAYPAFFGSFSASDSVIHAIQDAFAKNQTNWFVTYPITAVYYPPGSQPAGDPIIARGAVPRPKPDDFEDGNIPGKNPPQFP